MYKEINLTTVNNCAKNTHRHKSKKNDLQKKNDLIIYQFNKNI